MNRLFTQQLDTFYGFAAWRIRGSKRNRQIRHRLHVIAQIFNGSRVAGKEVPSDPIRAANELPDLLDFLERGKITDWGLG